MTTFIWLHAPQWHAYSTQALLPISRWGLADGTWIARYNGRI